MFGRLDNVRFQTGLALCRNAIVLPHGPATKRAGTYYVNKAGNSSYAVRVIPFAFSATQTMVLELGNNYLRFHTNGASLSVGTPAAYNGATAYTPGDLVASGGTNYVCITNTTGNAPPNATYWYAQPSTGEYTLPTPWAAADLMALEYTQSSDVITVTHNGYAVSEIRRLGATKWAITTPALGAAVPTATISSVTTVVGTGTAYNKVQYYKVTVVSPDGLEESLGSASGNSTNDLTLSGAKNVVNWGAVSYGSGTVTYRVYKAINDANRLYGYVGETTGTSFTDDNITPDYSKNPPASTLRLDTAGNYPQAVAYYEQRRMFGGSTSFPQTVYGTRTGTESNLNISLPSNAGDALSFSLKAQQQHAVKHLVPLSDLIALTVSGTFRIASADGKALTAGANNLFKQANSYGANSVKPLLTGTNCLHAEANGRRVRDISYSWQSQTYVSDDRSIMSPHLFTDYTLVDAAYTRSPDSIAWWVRSDGALLGMSYVPEQQVWAWHQHTTVGGTVESICSVTESNQDYLYLVVLRTLNGVSTRVIERMASRLFTTQADAYFVDCGATYSGSPATTISGLTWLEGKSVVAYADGAVVTGLTVSGGAVTLPVAASKVHVGLAFTTDIQTLPMSLESMAAGGQGTTKSVTYAYLRVNRTGVVKVGPNSSRLTELPARTNEPYDTPSYLRSEVLDVLVNPDISQDAQLWVQSSDPSPLTISSIVMKVAFGG